ncbi:hypothetical protein B0H14DRAFT_2682085 [Mycena olivaceomarginata]|nr:hypothetical protein B0H14DRAFT_2682085 [Mycena olivaceomarginata]
MFIRPALLSFSSLFVSSALGSIALYGQCGGDDIVWPDTCAEGLACTYYNFWYSQCLPAAAAEPSSSSLD